MTSANASMFQRWTGGSLGILARSVSFGLLSGWTAAVILYASLNDFTFWINHINVLVLVSLLYFLFSVSAPVIVVGLTVHLMLVIGRASGWKTYVAAGAITGVTGLLVLDNIFGLSSMDAEIRRMYSPDVCAFAGSVCAITFWLSLRPDRGPRA